jgi:hypothetical protein
MIQRAEFRRELEALINKHSMENGSNTPDFILAKYLSGSLRLFDEATAEREQWYGTALRIGGPVSLRQPSAGSGDAPEPPAAAAPPGEPDCVKCAGCGQVADTDDQEPWTMWTKLPLESSAAVLMGLVKPKPCPACGGSGKAPRPTFSHTRGDSPLTPCPDCARLMALHGMKPAAPEPDPNRPKITVYQPGSDPSMRAFPYPKEDRVYVVIMDSPARGLYFMMEADPEIPPEDQQHLLQVKLIDVLGLSSRRFRQLTGDDRKRAPSDSDPKFIHALERVYQLAKEMEEAAKAAQDTMTAAAVDA